MNLPPLEEALKRDGYLPEDHECLPPEREKLEPIDESFDDELNSEALQAMEIRQERLAMIEGKDHADAMDQVFKETLEHAQNLMDLGFNTEPNRQRGIFEVAVGMYGRVLEAKNSKRDSQLKAMKLALDQKKLELDELRIKGKMEDNTIESEGPVVVEDRNELIKRIREQMKRQIDDRDD